MKFNTVIAAVDLEDDLAAGVVRVACSLAQKDDATLEIVSVWPALSAVTPVFSAEVAGSSAALSQAAIEAHKTGREASETRLAELAAGASGAKPVLLDGDPADAVADYAEKVNADLIVTGSHQRNFWNTILQGSASKELVNEAPCAVLLVTKAYAAKFLTNG